MMRLMRIVRGLGLCFLLQGPGCFNAYDLDPSELTRLGGYVDAQAGRAVQRKILARNGKELTFSRKVQLELSADNAEEIKGHYLVIKVQDGRFYGARTHGPPVIDLRIDQIYRAEAKIYSAGKTAGLTIGLLTGALLLGGLGVIGAMLSID